MPTRTRSMNRLSHTLGKVLHWASFLKRRNARRSSSALHGLDHERIHSLWKQDRTEEMYRLLNGYLVRCPADPHALNRKAMYLIYQNRLPEALPLLDQALAADPQHDSALNNKSWALHNLGRFEEALLLIEQAIDLTGGTTYEFTNKGNALMGLTRYEEALDAYTKALQMNSGNHHARYGLALSYKHLKKLEQAVLDFMKYVDLNPEDPEGYFQLSDCLHRLGKLTEEKQTYDRWSTVEQHNHYMLSRKGSVLLALRQFSDALEHYESAVSHFPQSAELRYGLGRAYSSMQRVEEAIDQLIRAIGLDEEYGDYILADHTLKDLQQNERFKLYFDQLIEQQAHKVPYH